MDVSVDVTPRTTLEQSVDSFSSIVLTGNIEEPHNAFSFRVRGIAFVDNEHIATEPCKPLYRFESDYTHPGSAIDKLIATCERSMEEEQVDSSDVHTMTMLIMDAVYNAFVYTPGVTTVRTTAEEALAQHQGVCQDYAHVMLAVCRHFDIPARYIAGLLVGEGATHAWVEVYMNDRWIGFDPTHNCAVNDDYITIAHGRDYGDCAIDIGVFSGSSVQQTQWVNASVHEQ